MRQLWAPWRMVYIDQAIGQTATESGCIFCSKPQRNPTFDEEQLILYRGATCFIMMNLYPYNSGHLLISPYQHTGSLAGLPDETALEMIKLVQKCETACRAALNPDGFNIGANLGQVAGAGFPDHVHMHLVPRWGGDTNFMPVIADVKIMPEFLQQTYAKIHAALIPLLEL
jgi:ATP adenylyltransferase